MLKMFNLLFCDFLIISGFIGCVTMEVDGFEWNNPPPTSLYSDTLALEYIAVIDDPMYANCFGSFTPVCVIDKTLFTEYMITLENEPFYEISKEIYQTIAGIQLTEKHAIIVRAVYTVLGGNYSVYQNSAGDIFISYGVLTKVKERNLDFHKGIVLVAVDVLPNNVYVSYTSCE